MPPPSPAVEVVYHLCFCSGVRTFSQPQSYGELRPHAIEIAGEIDRSSQNNFNDTHFLVSGAVVVKMIAFERRAHPCAIRKDKALLYNLSFYSFFLAI